MLDCFQKRAGECVARKRRVGLEKDEKSPMMPGVAAKGFDEFWRER